MALIYKELKRRTMEYILPDLNLMNVTMTIEDGGASGKFIIEPLSPGYGVTVGNSLRRILLSSLEGAAIRSVKIAGVDHEFSPIQSVKEDAVDLILNLKAARFKLNGDGPATLSLSVKGPKKVTCADFTKTSDLEAVDKDHYLATVEKGGKLEIEIEVDRGRGYVPVEKRSDEKVPVGTILVDSIYTPVKKVKYDIENTRVGSVTNYDKLIFEITTDGSITAQEALNISGRILVEHVGVIVDATQAANKQNTGKGEKAKVSKEKNPSKTKAKTK